MYSTYVLYIIYIYIYIRYCILIIFNIYIYIYIYVSLAWLFPSCQPKQYAVTSRTAKLCATFSAPCRIPLYPIPSTVHDIPYSNYPVSPRVIHHAAHSIGHIPVECMSAPLPVATTLDIAKGVGGPAGHSRLRRAEDSDRSSASGERGLVERGFDILLVLLGLFRDASKTKRGTNFTSSL